MSLQLLTFALSEDSRAWVSAKADLDDNLVEGYASFAELKAACAKVLAKLNTRPHAVAAVRGTVGHRGRAPSLHSRRSLHGAFGHLGLGELMERHGPEQ